jgi:hypothetical protein
MYPGRTLLCSSPVSSDFDIIMCRERLCSRIGGTLGREKTPVVVVVLHNWPHELWPLSQPLRTCFPICQVAVPTSAISCRPYGHGFEWVQRGYSQSAISRCLLCSLIGQQWYRWPPRREMQALKASYLWVIAASAKKGGLARGCQGAAEPCTHSKMCLQGPFTFFLIIKVIPHWWKLGTYEKLYKNKFKSSKTPTRSNHRFQKDAIWTFASFHDSTDRMFM